MSKKLVGTYLVLGNTLDYLVKLHKTYVYKIEVTVMEQFGRIVLVKMLKRWLEKK